VGDGLLGDVLRRRNESSVSDAADVSGSSTVRRQPGVDQADSPERDSDDDDVGEDDDADDDDRRAVGVSDLVDDGASGEEVTGDDVVVADGVTAPLDRVDVPVDGPFVSRSESDDGKVVQSGRAPVDRRTASAAARDDVESVDLSDGFVLDVDVATGVVVLDVDVVVLGIDFVDVDAFGAAVRVDDAVVGERRAGGPSRSDDFPAGRASGRARGGRGVAGRTAG
jgi:hypothetical protein